VEETIVEVSIKELPDADHKSLTALHHIRSTAPRRDWSRLGKTRITTTLTAGHDQSRLSASGPDLHPKTRTNELRLLQTHECAPKDTKRDIPSVSVHLLVQRGTGISST
jgi:hypothetical protein